jgi:hypothetical protein
VHGNEGRDKVRALLDGYDLEPVGSEWRIGATPVRNTIDA